MAEGRLGSLLALALLLAARSGVACDGERPIVGVRFRGDPDVAFERAVLADLEAGLARSNLSVCPLGSTPPPIPAIAELSVDTASLPRVELSVRVHNGKADLQLDRPVELAQVPADSRAFAVALAADELLRATGLEWLGGPDAAATDAPPVEQQPTQPSNEADGLSGEASQEAPAIGSWSLGLRAALERFGGGQTLWGADAGVLLALPARFELQLAPGLRRGVAVSAPNGRIESSALSLAASARYRLIDTSWQLATGVGLQALRLDLAGVSSSSSTTASQLEGVALYAQGVLAASVPLAGPLRLELFAALGVPLRELEATADGHTATAASGLQLGLASALWLQL